MSISHLIIQDYRTIRISLMMKKNEEQTTKLLEIEIGKIVTNMMCLTSQTKLWQKSKFLIIVDNKILYSRKNKVMTLQGQS